MAAYAWSPILAGDKSAKFGDEVTASGLGISKEDFEELALAGSIRSKKPPKLPEGYQGSVVDFLREQIKEAELAAGASFDEAALESMAAIGEVS